MTSSPSLGKADLKVRLYDYPASTTVVVIVCADVPDSLPTCEACRHGAPETERSGRGRAGEKFPACGLPAEASPKAGAGRRMAGTAALCDSARAG